MPKDKTLEKAKSTFLASLELKNDDPLGDEVDEYDRQMAFELMDFVEQIYYLEGRVVTPNDVHQYQLKEEIYNRWIQSVEWRDLLSQRGIPILGSHSKVSPTALTSEQWNMIKVMTDLNDTRSDKKKLSDNGINTATWQAWLADETFSSILKEKTERQFANSQHEALLSVLDGTKSGDLGATKLYLEMTGRHSPNSNSLNFSLATIVNMLMEIIQEEVKDPEVLQRIGNRAMGVVAEAVSQTNHQT